MRRAHVVHHVGNKVSDDITVPSARHGSRVGARAASRRRPPRSVFPAQCVAAPSGTSPISSGAVALSFGWPGVGPTWVVHPLPTAPLDRRGPAPWTEAWTTPPSVPDRCRSRVPCHGTSPDSDARDSKHRHRCRTDVSPECALPGCRFHSGRSFLAEVCHPLSWIGAGPLPGQRVAGCQPLPGQRGRTVSHGNRNIAQFNGSRSSRTPISDDPLAPATAVASPAAATV